jgi:hypothetical protein
MRLRIKLGKVASYYFIFSIILFLFIFIKNYCYTFLNSAENEGHEGKRRVETVWPIFQLHHQRSRYIYELYYKRKAISKELYEYCLSEKYADKALIAKWKKVRGNLLFHL